MWMDACEIVVVVQGTADLIFPEFFDLRNIGIDDSSYTSRWYGMVFVELCGSMSQEAVCIDGM
jgi:hypothetical protein